MSLASQAPAVQPNTARIVAPLPDGDLFDEDDVFTRAEVQGYRDAYRGWLSRRDRIDVLLVTAYDRGYRSGQELRSCVTGCQIAGEYSSQSRGVELDF